ncbi:hypothetical protein GmHk_18G052248 [Glycine max]|nr:hypothetical protein GmHk_18G052248 [Glycine max]
MKEEKKVRGEKQEHSEKHGHFKSDCPKLEKSKDKYKYYKSKEKKSFVSTWETLGDTTSNEEGKEEANLCLMVDIALKHNYSNSSLSSTLAPSSMFNLL